MKEKRVIVISAVSFTGGGPLSILEDCLSYLSSCLSSEYRIIALINNKNLLVGHVNERVELIEFPRASKSYIYRLYLEYFKFKKISQESSIFLWFSLHDFTPNVNAQVRAVYCHNPAPFYKPRLIEDLSNLWFIIFYKIYGFFYRINISKNNFVIVQQEWIRQEFIERYKVKKILISHPEIVDLKLDNSLVSGVVGNDDNTFFFPTFSRFFKNIEVVCEAVILLNQEGKRFNVIITVDGTENSYSKKIVSKYKDVPNINFIGLVSRESVFNLYKQSCALIFPSRLETWGLPITEFKSTGKVILAADLPYAHETVGDYDNVSFFSPMSEKELFCLMRDVTEGKFIPQGNNWKLDKQAYSSSGWKSLFSTLLDQA